MASKSLGNAIQAATSTLALSIILFFLISVHRSVHSESQGTSVLLLFSQLFRCFITCLDTTFPSIIILILALPSSRLHDRTIHDLHDPDYLTVLPPLPVPSRAISPSRSCFPPSFAGLSGPWKFLYRILEIATQLYLYICRLNMERSQGETPMVCDSHHSGEPVLVLNRDIVLVDT